MRKGTVVTVLILVILILCGVFAWIVKFITPVLIILGLLLACIGALFWVLKTKFKSSLEKKEEKN